MAIILSISRHSSFATRFFRSKCVIPLQTHFREVVLDIFDRIRGGRRMCSVDVGRRGCRDCVWDEVSVCMLDWGDEGDRDGSLAGDFRGESQKRNSFDA